MSTSPLLPALKKKIQEANKELMDLTDGCHIKIWWMDSPYDRLNDPDEEDIIFTSRTMKDNGGYDKRFHGIMEDNFNGVIEILGHDIQLQHILRTMYENNAPYGIHPDGEFMHWGDTSTGIYYNLLETFDNQLPAVHEWLAGLLNVTTD